MNPRRACGGRRQLGFSLFELLLVLVLLATLLAVAAPRLRPSATLTLDTATRTLVNALRQTRLTAMEQGRPLALQVDVERRELMLGAGGPRRTLPEELTLELTTAARERSDPQRAGVRFFADGSSTGGRVTLRLAGQVRHVDVAWLTGRIRLLDTARNSP